MLDRATYSQRSPGLTLAFSLAQAQPSGPVHVVIDTKSLKRRGASEWLAGKHGERGTRRWRRLRLDIDPNILKILASKLPGNHKGDTSQVGPLLGPIPGPIASTTADGC